MKLYVVPLASKCNGRCGFCITKFRKVEDGLLPSERLLEVLESQEFEKIEITGGGEPGLHPQIDEIVEICSRFAPTQLYTNGTYAPPLHSPLASLCLSRAHYEDAENKKIMGISACPQEIKVPLKLSLLAHWSGINTEREAIKYLEWAKNFSKKVVIRKLFLHEGDGYDRVWGKEYVDTSEWFSGIKATITENGGRIFNYKGLSVEIEGRDCACEDTSPVLFANGSLASGWGV